CHHSEEQMGDRHGWCRPKGNRKTKVDRVTNVLIKHRRPEREWLILLTSHIEPHLPQSEQIEMIDQERTHQYNSETEKAKRLQCDAKAWHRDIPYYPAQRLPEPEQQQQT